MRVKVVCFLVIGLVGFLLTVPAYGQFTAGTGTVFSRGPGGSVGIGEEPSGLAVGGTTGSEAEANAPSGMTPGAGPGSPNAGRGTFGSTVPGTEGSYSEGRGSISSIPGTGMFETPVVAPYGGSTNVPGTVP